MSLAQTTAPDYSGLSVMVFDLAEGGKLPDFNTDIATTYAGAVEVGHIEDFSDGGASRATRKYTPLNDKKYAEVVSTGSISHEPFTIKVLYDPELKTEGVSKMEKAFDENKPIGLLFEIANAKTSGGKGTTYAYATKISKFAINGEKDGKLLVDITVEKLGSKRKHEAS